MRFLGILRSTRWPGGQPRGTLRRTATAPEISNSPCFLLLDFTATPNPSRRRRHTSIQFFYSLPLLLFLHFELGRDGLKSSHRAPSIATARASLFRPLPSHGSPSVRTVGPVQQSRLLCCLGVRRESFEGNPHSSVRGDCASWPALACVRYRCVVRPSSPRPR